MDTITCIHKILIITITTNFSFAQHSVAKKLWKDLNFTRDMGKIHTAMENQLQELNVKRQAYHSNSFVGNHVNTCLEVHVHIFLQTGN